MSQEAAIFIGFFGGLFVLRAIAATFVYAWLLSDAPDCPNCGGETIHVQSRGVSRLFPRLWLNWCPDCNWEGMLHPPGAIGGQPRLPSTTTASHSGQLPLISKKSSK